MEQNLRINDYIYNLLDNHIKNFLNFIENIHFEDDRSNDKDKYEILLLHTYTAMLWLGFEKNEIKKVSNDIIEDAYELFSDEYNENEIEKEE
jgi:hypothetical protein